MFGVKDFAGAAALIVRIFFDDVHKEPARDAKHDSRVVHVDRD